MRPVGAGLIVSRPHHRETPAGTRLLAPAGRELSGMAPITPAIALCPPVPFVPRGIASRRRQLIHTAIRGPPGSAGNALCADPQTPRG